jgi:hypothetical protein
MTRPLRVANCSGFYGDRLAAPRQLLEGGPIDFLTGDYLAELTMLILWKDRQKDPDGGYARTFLHQMEDVLDLIADQGIRVVVNAGGLNPAGLARRLEETAAGLNRRVPVAYVEGDDVLGRLEEFRAAGHPLAHLDTGRPFTDIRSQVVTAHAYLGAWGIVEALRAGAQIVVCGRVADASLVVGPAAYAHGWDRTDWDPLAGAVAAGHVLECGAQTTGGNYSFFQEVPGLEEPGFPVAEIADDGSFVVTKHPGTGGLVSVGTVTAQLLYEIAEPAYANPDVIARFDSLQLTQLGPDRVQVTGARGAPAPDQTKLGINYLGGYRNSMTMALTGLDVEEKAAAFERALMRRLGGSDQFASFEARLVRTDHIDPPTNEAASATLTITVKDPDPELVGRAFSSAVTELALANYPGLYATAPPGSARSYGVYWPTLAPSHMMGQRIVYEGVATDVAPVPALGIPPTEPEPSPVPPPAPAGPTATAPLGRAFGTRSGDKGGNANLGVWARTDAGYAWLHAFLTADRLKALLPETAAFEIRRYELPNLRALNFVIVGLLGEGVASSTRPDPQAKSLGEFLRARLIELPVSLLSDPEESHP